MKIFATIILAVLILFCGFSTVAIAATDGNGNILWKENFRPFGERLNNEPASNNNRQWFHRKAADAETGLSYFGARYYDPVIGRFMGVDAVGVQEDNLHSFNRYAYGNGNPYRYIDPDGNLPVLVFLIPVLKAMAVGGAAGATIGGATSAGVQYATTGRVDLGQVGQDAVIGGAVGAVTGGVGGGVAQGVNAARVANVLQSASRPARVGSQESRALQALRKKIDRGDEAFSGLPKTQDSADDLIRQILDARNTVVRTKTRNGQTVRDVFDQNTGRGVRTIDGEFDTFVNL